MDLFFLKLLALWKAKYTQLILLWLVQPEACVLLPRDPEVLAPASFCQPKSPIVFSPETFLGLIQVTSKAQGYEFAADLTQWPPAHLGLPFGGWNSSETWPVPAVHLCPLLTPSQPYSLKPSCKLFSPFGKDLSSLQLQLWSWQSSQGCAAHAAPPAHPCSLSMAQQSQPQLRVLPTAQVQPLHPTLLQPAHTPRLLTGQPLQQGKCIPTGSGVISQHCALNKCAWLTLGAAGPRAHIYFLCLRDEKK